MPRKIIQTILLFLFPTCFTMERGWGDTSSDIWPFWNEWTSSQGTNQWQAAGPLIFGAERADGSTVAGIRPFFADFKGPEKGDRRFYTFYPAWSYRESEVGYQWSIFSLIRSYRQKGEDGKLVASDFDIFPILWTRTDPDPNRSYFGIFPLGGVIKNRLWTDRIDWVMFPFFSRSENKGEIVYSHPWPFFRTQTGMGSGGFSLWPLYSHRYREGFYDRKYALWPIYYNYREKLDQQVPTHKFGVLPFYSSVTAENERSEHYPWPFFGYVEKQNPDYREDHYLWPLWLTASGEPRQEQRWLPFYSHSIEREPYSEKRWYAWPLLRVQEYEQNGMFVEKEQLLFFLFWNMRQSRIGQTGGPVIKKTHVWPFISSWENGMGREQVQFLSPFEVFFTNNEAVRELYTPLFALYRKDVDLEASYLRHDFLFNLITWEEKGDEQRFDLGPILQQRSGQESFSFQLLYGLLGWSHQADGNYLHLLWFRL